MRVLSVGLFSIHGNLSSRTYLFFQNVFVLSQNVCLLAVVRHFESEGVTSNLYFMEWSMTLFTKRLNLEIASRVWDIVLVEKSERFVYVAAVGSLFRF